VSAAAPGHDEVVLTAPHGAGLCHSRGCAEAGRAAEVVVTFGTLNDPGASQYARGALWRECWHQPVPMCGGCWDSSRQVAVKYRPGLVVIDATAPGSPGGTTLPPRLRRSPA
jgi:hypothetical protein